MERGGIPGRRCAVPSRMKLQHHHSRRALHRLDRGHPGRDTAYNRAQVLLLDDYCGLGFGTRLLRGLLDTAARGEDRLAVGYSLPCDQSLRTVRLPHRRSQASPILSMVGRAQARVRDAFLSGQSLLLPPRVPRALIPLALIPRALIPRALIPRALIPAASMPPGPSPSIAASSTSSNMPVSTSMRIV